MPGRWLHREHSAWYGRGISTARDEAGSALSGPMEPTRQRVIRWTRLRGVILAHRCRLLENGAEKSFEGIL
jgi:hypothetical protein